MLDIIIELAAAAYIGSYFIPEEPEEEYWSPHENDEFDDAD
tara:strand:- start:987 stop:1109 length:123 start_codon:yes stop_codon:yes gene_type:complete